MSNTDLYLFIHTELWSLLKTLLWLKCRIITLFLYFNLCPSVKLDKFSCSFTSIPFPTNGYFRLLSNRTLFLCPYIYIYIDSTQNWLSSFISRILPTDGYIYDVIIAILQRCIIYCKIITFNTKIQLITHYSSYYSGINSWQLIPTNSTKI